MKGDFTRDTFRPGRHYWGVLRQQGRVDLDADWNEQVRIAQHHRVRRTADLVGAAGGPAVGAGFDVSVDGGGTVWIGAGRYYVKGILCENEERVAFDDQPDDPGEDLPDEEGLHVAYLDVWDRHVTAHDDPPLRETALDGPDTATRARTVWQVRTSPLELSAAELTDVRAAMTALAAARTAGDTTAEAAALAEIRRLAHRALCGAPLEPLGGSLEPGTGTLAARAAPGTEDPDDPCRFEPGGGYRRLENRLYRVEIHDGGPDTDATFKWSRDNGSMAFAVEEFVADPGDATTDRVRVRRLGFDAIQSLQRDDWVEVTGDDDERAGRPGTLVRITNEPDAAERVLELSEPVPVRDLVLHPRLRRWDMPVDVGLMDVKKVWAELEDGVQVRFGAGTFHTGDYWLIPARTHTADVEWPPYPVYPGEEVTAGPERLSPFGIEHRRAPLAVLAHDGASVVAAVDERHLYPAATGLTSLFYVGGDGQEPELPGGTLPQDLQVGVANGERPVEGVLVRFEVLEGGGTVDAGAGGAADLIVATGADGLVSVRWTVDPAQANHRVRARLLDRCEDPTHLPIHFSARVNPKLHYLSGDGQEGLPDETLPPLRVWVSDGRWPMEGARVRFTVIDGSGSLSATDPVVTGPDGMAEVLWTLGDEVRQGVEARLEDAAGDPIHQATVRFNARVGYKLHYLSGDGQEGLPGDTLPPLRVWVSDGRSPLEGALVRFRVTRGNGSLSVTDPVPTDTDGVAEADWTLGDDEPRQQVEASLEDAAGAPIHQATIRFNANLSLADRVRYEAPEGCVELADVDTVAEALDVLCRRERAGSCRIVVSAGADVAAIWRAIQDTDRFDGSICFAEGTFTVDEPLVLMGKGHITVSGVGRATRIICGTAETALRFEECASVRVHSLYAEAKEVPGKGDVNGVLTFQDCGAVDVDGAVLRCGWGTWLNAAGITVRHSESGSERAAEPLRIRRCDIEAGEMQAGIWILGRRHTVVEGNTIRAGGPGGEILGALLADDRYREMVLRGLVTFEDAPELEARPEEGLLAEVDPAFRLTGLDTREEPAAEEDLGFQPMRLETADEPLIMNVRISTEETWSNVLATAGALDMGPSEAADAVREVLDGALADEGRSDLTTAFRLWFTRVQKTFAPALSYGIFMGGAVAEDVRVLHNAVSRSVYGLVVATGGGRAGTVQVTGNTLEVPGSSLVSTSGVGIFVESCESLVVAENGVLVTERTDADPVSPLAVSGVRIFGEPGPRLIVRGGHYDGTVKGVWVSFPRDFDAPVRARWVAADNVATTGPMLVAPCEVVDDGNIPPRQPAPCPGDRPAGSQG